MNSGRIGNAIQCILRMVNRSSRPEECMVNGIQYILGNVNRNSGRMHGNCNTMHTRQCQ